MKKCLLILLLFCFKNSFSQFTDDFSDGDFTSNPTWTGSSSGTDFIVVSNRLRSNSTTINSNFYLSTPNSLASNCTWEFYCNLQFATSGSNYVDIYLTSDKADLQSASINGYFVRIGNTDDEVCLFKRSGALSTAVKIIDGVNSTISSTTNNIVKVKVTRTSANVFTLERDLTGTGSGYVSEGSVTDATFTTSSFFGVYVQQSTASFVQKHFFDDFVVKTIIVDVTPPKLSSATVIDSLTIEAAFDEPLDSVSTKQVANYSITNTMGNPVSVKTTTDPSRYRLTLSKGLSTATYILTVSNVKDRSGNVISGNNTATFSYIKPYVAKFGDVVINEIFADPSPQIDLPSVEFIELWNQTTQTISFKNWTYSDPTTNFKFTKDSIAPNEYLILCAKADTNEFKKYGRVLGLSPWPSLNNFGDNIILKNQNGTMISQVAYTDAWYKDAVKKNGGWTLELIDPKATCSGIQNWGASVNTNGGTPGAQNSIYKANASSVPLQLLSAVVIDSLNITLTFNRFVDSLSAANRVNYSINNGVGNPATALPVSPLFEQVNLKLSAPLVRGNNFTITVSNITDCAGGLVSSTGNSAVFFFPKRIGKGDVIINEVLFNPRPNGVDFVEIYNNSANAIDLKDLYIANIAKDTVANQKQVSTTSLIMQPKQYYVLTTDPDNIKKEYQTQNPNGFIKLASMPSYNDDAGSVVLVSNKVRIDQFNYTTKMHFALIKDPEGVSLERSSFTRPTNETGNFRSAAAAVGYATPGYKNSQFTEDVSADSEFFLTSKTFSPDNDGFEDILQVNYNFAKPGLVMNADIYSDKGVIVKRIAKNLTLGASGSVIWDGLNEYSERCSTGIYLIYADVFDLDGKVKKYRKTFALAAKL